MSVKPRALAVRFNFGDRTEQVEVAREAALRECWLLLSGYQQSNEDSTYFDFDCTQYVNKGQHYQALSDIRPAQLFFGLIENIDVLLASNKAKARLYDVFTEFARSAMKLKKTYKGMQQEAEKKAKKSAEERIRFFEESLSNDQKQNPEEQKKLLENYKADVKTRTKKAIQAEKKVAKNDLQKLLHVLRGQYYDHHADLWSDIRLKESVLSQALTGQEIPNSENNELSAGLPHGQWMQILILAKVFEASKIRTALLEHIGHDFGTFADRPEWNSVWVGSDAYSEGVAIQKRAQELLPAAPEDAKLAEQPRTDLPSVAPDLEPTNNTDNIDNNTTNNTTNNIANDTTANNTNKMDSKLPEQEQEPELGKWLRMGIKPKVLDKAGRQLKEALQTFNAVAAKAANDTPSDPKDIVELQGYTSEHLFKQVMMYASNVERTINVSLVMN